MENLKNLNSNQSPEGIGVKKFILIFVIVILVGGAVGFVLSNFGKNITGGATSGKTIKTEKSAGILDKKTFKDKAEGILKEGGIDGEGNFHLERPGGVSQNVYLTSSTVDLALFIGKKVRTWGVTFKAEKAGWLMDVGYIELIN